MVAWALHKEPADQMSPSYLCPRSIATSHLLLLLLLQFLANPGLFLAPLLRQFLVEHPRLEPLGIVEMRREIGRMLVQIVLLDDAVQHVGIAEDLVSTQRRIEVVSTLLMREARVNMVLAENSRRKTKQPFSSSAADTAKEHLQIRSLRPYLYRLIGSSLCRRRKQRQRIQL